MEKKTSVYTITQLLIVENRGLFFFPAVFFTNTIHVNKPVTTSQELLTTLISPLFSFPIRVFNWQFESEKVFWGYLFWIFFFPLACATLLNLLRWLYSNNSIMFLQQVGTISLKKKMYLKGNICRLMPAIVHIIEIFVN